MPLSWRHWVYGLGWIGRDHQRTVKMYAESIRIGRSTKEDYDAFCRDVAMTTGVPRDG